MSTDCAPPWEEGVIAAVRLLRYGDASNPIQSVVLAAASAPTRSTSLTAI